MATGDFTVFEEFAAQLGAENHVLGSGGDTIKLAIITATLEPVASATAVWATWSANDVSAGGNYVAGGIDISAGQSYTEAAGVATYDSTTNISLAQNASGFTDGRWGILYNDTNATKMAIGFLDLGGTVSEVAGPVAINWGETGIFTVTVS